MTQNRRNDIIELVRDIIIRDTAPVLCIINTVEFITGRGILMVYNIKIDGPEAAQKLNRTAEKCAYDVWIHGKSGQADAKSALGLMLLSLESDLKLVVDDGVDKKAVEKAFADFIA